MGECFRAGNGAAPGFLDYAILRRVKHRVVSPWLWFALLVAVVGAMLFLRRSDADRIRGDLESMADALNYDVNGSRQNWRDVLNTVLRQRVSSPVTILIEPSGESTVDTDSLVNAAVEYTRDLSAMTVELFDVRVKLDEDGRRATAKGEAILDIVDTTGTRRNEPRKFALTLERSAKEWVIVHAQIAEPRIDQPEARP